MEKIDNGSITFAKFGGNVKRTFPLKRVILLREEDSKIFEKCKFECWQIEGWLAIEGTKNGKSSFTLEYRAMLHSKRDF